MPKSSGVDEFSSMEEFFAAGVDALPKVAEKRRPKIPDAVPHSSSTGISSRAQSKAYAQPQPKMPAQTHQDEPSQAGQILHFPLSLSLKRRKERSNDSSETQTTSPKESPNDVTSNQSRESVMKKINVVRSKINKTRPDSTESESSVIQTDQKVKPNREEAVDFSPDYLSPSGPRLTQTNE